MELKSAIRTNPFGRLLIFYLSGIIIGSILKIPHNPVFISGFLLLTPLLFVSFIVTSLKPRFHTEFITGIIACAMLLSAGVLNCCVHNYKAGLIKSSEGFKGTVRMVIQDPVTETERSVKSIARITGMLNLPGLFNGQTLYKQKVIVYFGKDSFAKSLKPGDKLICPVSLRKIPSPLNPREFDYSKFLATKDIFNQTYIQSSHCQVLPKSGLFSVKAGSFNMQQALIGKYREIGLNKTLFSILSAITLGYKNDLELQTRQAFSKAGVMHVMALSGFNVAVIAFALNILLYFMSHIVYGNILKTLVIILIIWLFAFVTGLSPSVTRASVMISLVLTGKTMNRNLKVSNILYASAFILLTFSPALILDISFQLSFAAVFGILVFHPAIYGLVTFRIQALSKIWQLFSVSCAAQLATLPLTLFYFHQFPVYFWLTNIFVIPLVSVIICIAGVFLLVSFIHPMMVFTGKILSLLLSVLYKGIVLTELLPFSLIDHISISPQQLVILVLLVISMALYIWQKKLFYVYAGLVIVILYQAVSIRRITQYNRQRIFLVSSIRDYPVVNLISGRTNYFFTYPGLSKEEPAIVCALENFWIEHGVGDRSIIRQDISTEKNYIFSIDGVYGMVLNDASRLPDRKINILILTGKVPFMPELIKRIHPQQIILDTSVSARESRKWLKICSENHMNCRAISIHGAFVCDIRKFKVQPNRFLALK